MHYIVLNFAYEINVTYCVLLCTNVNTHGSTTQLLVNVFTKILYTVVYKADDSQWTAGQELITLQSKDTQQLPWP